MSCLSCFSVGYFYLLIMLRCFSEILSLILCQDPLQERAITVSLSIWACVVREIRGALTLGQVALYYARIWMSSSHSLACIHNFCVKEKCFSSPITNVMCEFHRIPCSSNWPAWRSYISDIFSIRRGADGLLTLQVPHIPPTWDSHIWRFFNINSEKTSSVCICVWVFWAVFLPASLSY